MQQVVVLPDETRLSQTVRQARELADDQLVIVGLTHAPPIERVLRAETREALGPFMLLSRKTNFLGNWRIRPPVRVPSRSGLKQHRLRGPCEARLSARLARLHLLLVAASRTPLPRDEPLR